MNKIAIFRFQFSRAKTRRRFVQLAFVAVLVLLLGGAVVFFFPQRILTIDSGEVKAEAMVVLGGGGAERTGRAAELFKAGEAPLIICSGIGDAESNGAWLTNSGVPVEAILLEPQSHTTRENAKFSIAMLRALGIHRVIIVTSWYHSRRALMCFEHYAPDMQFYSRPSYSGYSKTEWNRSGVSGYMKAEYPKLLGYWACYGVCPF